VRPSDDRIVATIDRFGGFIRQFTTGHFLGNTEFHRDFTEVHGELMRKTVFGVKLIPLFNISG
jgi:hypothetical protein